MNWSVSVLSFLSHVDKYVLCSVIFSLFYLTFTCVHVLTFFYVTEGFMDWIVRLNLATQATEDRLKMNLTFDKNFWNPSTGYKRAFIKIICLQNYFYIKTNIIDNKILYPNGFPTILSKSTLTNDKDTFAEKIKCHVVEWLWSILIASCI